jgi:hypothetical protein
LCRVARMDFRKITSSRATRAQDTRLKITTNTFRFNKP